MLTSWVTSSASQPAAVVDAGARSATRARRDVHRRQRVDGSIIDAEQLRDRLAPPGGSRSRRTR